MTSLEVLELKEDIKVFAKIKKTQPEENLESYLEIPYSKNKIIYKEHLKNLEIQKYEYPINKVFIEDDEYSYIYEDITRNTINDAINGINFAFFTYGSTNSEKHDLLFASENSKTNINERGIFPRLIQNILQKPNIKINISLMFIYNGKLYDISKIAFSKNNINNIEDIIKDGVDIGQNSDIIEQISKVKITNYDNLIDNMEHYINVFNILKKNDFSEIQKEKRIIESKFPFIFSFSTFLYIIYIYDDENRSNLISNISLIEFPGNDILITKITAPNSSFGKKIYNTKHFIENTNNIECIKKSIVLLKRPIIVGTKNINNAHFDLCLDSRIMIVLKNLSFSKINTRFRFIGCLYPNLSFQKSSKDVLDNLFQIQKIIFTKNYDFSEEDKEKIDKDKYILSLEERLKDFQRTIKHQDNILLIKQRKNIILKDNYQEQINALKKAFNFNGNIEVLLSGNENTKEFKYAKKVREALTDLKNSEYTIEKLKEQIKFLENEIQKNNNLNQIKLQDKHMIEYLNDIRERSSFEQNKLKIYLDHDIKLNELENENKKLNKIINEYKKENDNKFQFINNLPNSLQDNCNIQKNINEIKKNIENEFNQKLKKEVNHISNNNKKEREKIEIKYNKLIQLKEEENIKLKNEIENINKEKNINYNNLQKESVLLYELLINIIQKHKKDFSSFNYSSLNSNQKFQNFILLKDKFQELLNNTEKSLSMFSFPLTLKEVNSKYNNILNKGDFKELKISPIKKISNNSFYSNNNNLIDNINEIIKKNEILEKENEELKQKLEKIQINNIKIDNFNLIDESNIFNVDKKLMNDKEKIRKKLEESIYKNNQNEIIIKSQKRTIDQLNNENLLMKSNSQLKLKNINYSKLFKKRGNDSLQFNKNSFTNFNNQNRNFISLNNSSSNRFKRPLTGLSRSASLIYK